MVSTLCKRVAVGVSGGVDSAVAAMLLKRKGYDVHGVFMRNWDEQEESGSCSGEKDCAAAEWVCQRLNIPFTEMNFVQQYWNDVFQYVLSECQNGRTPNPDLLCNRHIKFGSLAEACRERLGAEYLATGHYARLGYNSSQRGVRLLRAVDESKDQSFFLSQVTQEALSKAIFPLGGLLKTRVREMAEEAGLYRVARKKDSTGICFIGKRNFPQFISQYLPAEGACGRIVDVDTGSVVGRHCGLYRYTEGQRCTDTLPALAKYYVTSKDVDSGDIYVCCGRYHPALYSTSLHTATPHWLTKPLLLGQQMRCLFRFEHRRPLVPCTVHCLPLDDRGPLLQRSNEGPHSSMSHLPTSTDTYSSESEREGFIQKVHNGNNQLKQQISDVGGLLIQLDDPMRAITTGQFAVLYRGDQCLGSAIIEQNGPSLFDRNVRNCRSDIQSLRQLLPTLSTSQLAQATHRTARDIKCEASAREYTASVAEAKEQYLRLVNSPQSFVNCQSGDS